MTQYDPRMSGDVRFSMGMTSFPGEDFARYVQAVAKMQSDHSSGEIATSPTPFASFSPPSHPCLHPYDAIYNGMQIYGELAGSSAFVRVLLDVTVEMGVSLRRLSQMRAVALNTHAPAS
jgi:hypothetical protein